MSILSPADRAELVADIADAVAERLAKTPKLVDRVALSRILGISVATIERLQADGLIPVVRAGRRCLYATDAVIAALSKNDDRRDAV